MSKGTRYTYEFKQEAVNQVLVRGYAVREVSERLGVSDKTLYLWLKKFDKPKKQRQQERDLQAENAPSGSTIVNSAPFALLLVSFLGFRNALISTRLNCVSRVIFQLVTRHA